MHSFPSQFFSKKFVILNELKIFIIMLKTGVFQKSNTLNEKTDKSNSEVEKMLSSTINFIQIPKEDFYYQIKL